MTTEIRRIRIRATKSYVVFRLEDELTFEELVNASRARIPPPRPRSQLLALAMRSSQRAAQAREADARAALTRELLPSNKQRVA